MSMTPFLKCMMSSLPHSLQIEAIVASEVMNMKVTDYFMCEIIDSYFVRATVAAPSATQT